jgi:hypothetical protein
VNGATLTTDRFGNANKAYSFDGVNDYITILHSNSLNLNQSLTLSCWVKLNNVSINQRLIDKSTNGTADSWLFDISSFQPGQMRLIVGGATANQAISNANLISNSIWALLTSTYDGNSVKFFVNGNFINSFIQTGSTPSNLNNVRFGANSVFTNHWLNGILDDVGIWSRALTECEIQDLYNAQLGSFSNTAVTVNPTNTVIGSNATLTVNSPVSNIQWQSNPSNVGWVNLSNNAQYNGVTNDTLVVSNLQLSNHNQPFRVLACGDTSNVATIQIADTCVTNVTIYDTLLTTVTDTLIINTTLSLPAPNNQNTILIYPNPASDQITIDNGNYAAMAGYSIKIENNAGQQVFQSAVNQPQFYIDLSTWSGNGLYFVHLIDPQNNTVTVRKIVLQ